MLTSTEVKQEVVLTQEIEHVLIVKPVDYTQIEKLSYKSELMEQWEVKSANNNDRTRKGRGSIRVRAINDKEFVLTAKNYSDDGISAVEIEQNTTREMFDVFKIICPMGSKKRRYFIECEDCIVEVDVYYDKSGKEIDWCKVDIEVSNCHSKLPDLPFAIEGTPITINRTPEQEEFVLNLFQEKFQIYNDDCISPLDVASNGLISLMSKI